MLCPRRTIVVIVSTSLLPAMFDKYNCNVCQITRAVLRFLDSGF